MGQELPEGSARLSKNRRSRTYRDKLLAAVAVTPMASLTPTETRIVEIVSRLGVTSMLGCAMVESGRPFSLGQRVTDDDLDRAVDLVLRAACRLDAQLQGFRQELEDHLPEE